MFDRIRLPSRSSFRRRVARSRRPAAAIERLEERLVLSATLIFRRQEGVDVSTNLENPVEGERGDGGTVAVATEAGSHLVAAFFFWQGEDRLDAGGDGSYDNAFVTFEGQSVFGFPVGVGPTADGTGGSSQAFRADVTHLMRDSQDGRYAFTGLAAQPGHRGVRASLLVLYRDGYGGNDRNVEIAAGDEHLPATLAGENPSLIDAFVFSSPAPAPVEPVTVADVALSSRGGRAVAGRLIAWRSNGVEVPEANRSISVWGPGGEATLIGGQTVIDSDAGTLVFDPAADSFVFTPREGFAGTATFHYGACDGPLEDSPVSTARITIEVEGTASVVDLDLTGRQDEPVTGRLVTRLWDGSEVPEERRYFGVRSAQGFGRLVYDEAWGEARLVIETDAGTLVVHDQSGDFVFTPQAGFVGTATFRYGFQDAAGLVGAPPLATITIRIEAAVPPVEEVDEPIVPPVVPPAESEAEESNDPPTIPIAPPASPRSGSPVTPATDPEENSKPGRTDPPELPISSDIEAALPDLSEERARDLPVTVFAASTDTQRPTMVTVTVPPLLTDGLGVRPAWPRTPTPARVGGDAGVSGGRAIFASNGREADGDGREDLPAVFVLDWTELWDAQEEATLTGSLV